jgi:feruloyl esterase
MIKAKARNLLTGDQRRRNWPRALMMSLAPVLLAGCAAIGESSSVTSAQRKCEDLKGTSISGGTVNSAESIPAGSYTPPGQTVARTALPAFCRVTVTMKPTPVSNITVEAWLPKENWNGRFLGTGNGSGGESVRYEMGLAEGLKRGFAVANTNLGTGPDARTVTQPERWEDFGYRANHQMTIAGKALVTAYYKSAPRYSYFSGCSTGGQQGLALAQRYPGDYDGVLVGAPAGNRTHLHMLFLQNALAFNAPGAKLTPGKISMITAKAVEACAGKDGGSPADKFLTDPRRCSFNPDTLPKCTGADDDSCLTGPQLAALKKAYAGVVNPRTGELIIAGVPYGSEAIPLGLAYQSDAKAIDVQLYPFKWAFGPGFDPAKFDFDQDVDAMDARLAHIVNINSPDLSRFKARGGKMMMYAGTADPIVPYHNHVGYYERVIQAQGGLPATQDFFRFYMVPGMGHCTGQLGGAGPGHFGQAFSAFMPQNASQDILMQLVDWVEKRKAPEEIIAASYVPASNPPQPAAQRPICVYPKLPTYKGGDRNKADSFACEEAPRGNVPTPAPRYLN